MMDVSHSPLDQGELIDDPQLGESHQPPTHQEGGDGSTKHSKHNDGAKILEEVSLQRRR